MLFSDDPVFMCVFHIVDFLFQILKLKLRLNLLYITCLWGGGVQSDYTLICINILFEHVWMLMYAEMINARELCRFVALLKQFIVWSSISYRKNLHNCIDSVMWEGHTCK